MTKRIILTVLQLAAFLGLLILGGYWDAVNLNLEMQQLQKGQTPHVLMQTIKYPVGSHILIANGLIFATVLLLLILLFLLVRKRLHPWALLSLLAYVLAICLSFGMKLGLVPAESPDHASLCAPRLTLEDPSALGLAPASPQLS